MRSVSLSCLGLLLGCAAPAPAKPSEDPSVAPELARLRAPYQESRAVVADRIEIVMSANFFNTEWGAPSVDRGLHEASHQKLATQDEYRWLNRAGGTQVPIRFAVGNTKFLALQSARLRVLGNGERITLDVAAEGHVSVLEGARRKDCEELRIEGGALRTR